MDVKQLTAAFRVADALAASFVFVVEGDVADASVQPLLWG